MKNVNDSDMDLRLAHRCVQSKWNSSNSGAGAGANAKSRSRLDMLTFMGPDPLAELVWSPQHGLSIKCVGCSSGFPDTKPCFLWDVGPSKSRSIRSGDSKDEIRVSEGHSVASRSTCHVDGEVAKCSSSVKTPSSSSLGRFFGSSHGHTGTEENIGEVNCAEKVSVVKYMETDDRNKGKEKECLSSSKSIPIGNVAETSEGAQNQRAADPLSEKLFEDGMTCDNNGLGFNVGSPLKIQAVTQCAPEERPVPDLPSSVRKHVERGKAKMGKDGCSSDAFLIAKDAILENEKRAQRRDLVPGEASSTDSRICSSRKSDKNGEKSLYYREGDEKYEDDSHGSMESCNSSNLMPKRKRKWSFDQQLILGSKRIKKQTQECLLSKPVIRQDSSFMNWISNMVKGLNRPNQEEVHSLALTVGHPIIDYENYDQKMSVCDKTRSLGGRKLGFQTVFQSLFSPDAKAYETRTHMENKSVGGSKEIVLADKTYAAITGGESYHSQTENLKQIAFGHEESMSIHACTKEANDGVSSFDSFQGVKISKTINCDLGSLWITRLCPKTPTTLLTLNHSDHKSLEAKDSSTDDASASASDGLEKVYEDKCKKPVEVTSLGTLKSTEEMALAFARRLDALKHIKPMVARDNTTHLKTTGHGLCDCSEIKERETEGLLRNISLYGGVKEARCLCAKCFQLNHWASTCPFSGTENKRCYSMINTKESQSEFGGSFCLEKSRMETDFNFETKENVNVCTEKRVLNFEKFPKQSASNSGKDELYDEKITLWSQFVSKQIQDAPKGMFDIVRRLRLSRTHILKWTNSQFPVAHLDGFFLRLRLAKWEEELGGARYYVACITGSQGEKPSKGSKKPIRVNVGGVECLVESRYVSNCDFLEDELAAWWQKTSRSGRILMVEDLKSKLEERKKLGL